MSAHINNNKKREHKQMTKAVQRARDLVKPTESDRTKVQWVDPNGLVGWVRVYFL